MEIHLIQWGKIINQVLNIILISMPEELFLVVLSLTLLKRFDFNIKINKEKEMLYGYKQYTGTFSTDDIFKISLCVVFVSLFANILKLVNVDANIVFIVSLFSVFFLLLKIYSLYDSSLQILKTLLCTLISFLTLMLIEFSYTPLILYITGENINNVNSSFLLNFLFSLPGRVIELSLLSYILLKKSSFSKLNFVKMVTYNKIITIIFTLIIIFNISFLLAFGKFIGFEKALSDISHLKQLLITSCIIVFPIINISLFIAIIHYTTNREIYKDFILQENMASYIHDIRFFAEVGNHDKMMVILEDFRDEINKLYNQNDKIR